MYQGSDGRGVGQSASKGRFPQTLLDCSSVESLGRGEELYLDRRCIHVSAWTTNYGEFTERGRPFRSVNVSSLLLQWDVLDGNPPPPMTGEGCEALNIFILYLALSKVQLHVGINILHGASIKLPPEPMISVIFEYMLSTPASMPFRTWYQTISPILLIFGIFEYLPSQTIFSSSLEPATNERPEKLVNTELCPLLNKGLSSVVDNYSTQPFPYYELYNVIQMVEITILLGLHLCIMVMIRVTLMSFCNAGKAVKSGQLVEFLCNAGKASKPGQLVEYLCNTGKMYQLGQLVESTDVLADVRGALVSLSHMPIFRAFQTSIFKIQICYHFLTRGLASG